MGVGPELRGMVMFLDISSLPNPSLPRNSVKLSASVVVDPEDHSNATVVAEPSKSSFSNTTSGTQAMVGAEVVGLLLVGEALGLPGVTVGPAVVGAPLVGLALVGEPLGLPGVTVGPAVVGAELVGAEVVGLLLVGEALGLPGVTVGPAVVGAPLVGLALVGEPLGLPGVTVGPAVVGAEVVAAQSK